METKHELNQELCGGRYDRLKTSRVKLGIRTHHFGAALAIAAIIFTAAFGYIGTHLPTKGSHASTPATPAVALCGSTTPTDPGPYTGPNLVHSGFGTTGVGAPLASTTVIPAINGFFRYWSNGSNARWYVLTANSTTSFSFTVYNAVTNSSTPIATFTIAIPASEQGQQSKSTFAVDPTSGDVYVGSYAVRPGSGPQGDVISRWSWTPGTNTTATEVWVAHMPTSDYLTGGIYGYTDASSVFRVAGVVSNGSNKYSVTFNGATGAAMANNAVIGSVINVSTDHSNDIISADSYGLGGYVRTYDSTGMTPGVYFGNGSNSNEFGFKYLNAATELSNGEYVVSDGQDGLSFFTHTGSFIGVVADTLAGDRNTGFIPLTNQIGGGNLTVLNGDFYYETGVNDPFTPPHDLIKVTGSDAANIIAAPQVSHFGVGAGMSTTATQNYYPTGTTPVVNVQFDPWWSTTASNYSFEYTVRTTQQVTTSTYSTAGTPTIVPLTTIMAAPDNGTYSLTLPTANPDLYQVNAHIIDSVGNQVGGQCLDYTVGAPGDTYNPATIAALPGNNQKAVAVASEFNQTLVRQTDSFSLDDCLPGYSASNPPTMSTTISCSPSVVADMNAAADMQASTGVKLEFQITAGSSLDSWLFDNHSNGVWQNLVTQMAQTFSHVRYWEALNETENTYTSNGATWIDNVIKPFYNGIKAANANDFVIGGSSAAVNTWFISAAAAADGGTGLNYMDAYGAHPYTGNNYSWEEEGMVAQIQKNQAIISASSHPSLPIYTTESGFWANGDTNDYMTQGNKLIRSLILGTSIGLDNNYYYYNTETGDDGSGVFWGLIDSQGINAGGLASITYKHMVKGLAFDGPVSTSTPHTHAYKFGPTANGSYVYVVWSEDYNIDVTATLAGGAAMTLTDEYGGPTIAPTTLASGGTVHLTGSVQYITAPNANALTLAPTESFGTNYAAQSQGGIATDDIFNTPALTSSAAATTNCGPAYANDSIGDSGYNGDPCSGAPYNSQNQPNGTSAWVPLQSDANPYLDIALKSGSPQTINRIYIAGTSIGSDKPGLRGFTVNVSKDGGSTYTPVTTVTNAFWQNNFMVPIGTQTGVTNIRLTNLTYNFNGYGDGSLAIWCLTPTSCRTTGGIYTVEAYSPGSVSGTANPPTVSITSPASTAYAHTTTTITATASDNSGSGLQRVEFYVDGNLVGTDTSSPYTYSWNTLASGIANGDHTLTTKAYDNDGGITTSSPVVVVVNNADANNAGSVGLYDLHVLANNYGKASGATFAQGDYNADGGIGLPDVHILANNYGWTAP